MKFIKIIIVVFVFSSCERRFENEAKAILVDNKEVSTNGVQILTIDSCEYIWCKKGYGAGLTHKGNCKYCIERNK